MLHITVDYDDKEIVKLILDVGVDVNVGDEDGRTMLYIATRCDNKKIVKLPLNVGANGNACGINDEVPLHVVAIYHNKIL